MARKRHTPEQILAKLRDADVVLAQGDSIAEVARKLEVSEQTYHYSVDGLTASESAVDSLLRRLLGASNVPNSMVTSDRISLFAPKAGKKSKAGSVPEGNLVR